MLADVRWTLGGPAGRPEFEAGHLPGAQYVDLEEQLSGRAGRGRPSPAAGPGRLPVRDAGRIGVRADRPVVAYDAATSQAAARLWWLLTDAGHRRGAGAQRWARGLAGRGPGHRVRARGRSVPPGDFVARPGQRRAGDRARRSPAGLADEAAPLLVDVRAPERFSGATEPIDPVAGHIPGAVNLPATGNLDAGRPVPARRGDRAPVRRGRGGPATPCSTAGPGSPPRRACWRWSRPAGPRAIYPGSWSDWITDPRPIRSSRPGSA